MVDVAEATSGEKHWRGTKIFPPLTTGFSILCGLLVSWSWYYAYRSAISLAVAYNNIKGRPRTCNLP